MARNAKIGYGNVEFYRGDGASPETFTKLSGLDEINDSGLSREVIEDVHFDMIDGYKEQIGGLRDAKEVTLKLIFDPDSPEYSALAGDIDSDDPVNYQIRVTGSSNITTYEFAGFVTEIAHGTPIGEKMTADVTIKRSGKPTKTTAPIV